jgi:hypothetical protein
LQVSSSHDDTILIWDFLNVGGGSAPPAPGAIENGAAAAIVPVADGALQLPQPLPPLAALAAVAAVPQQQRRYGEIAIDGIMANGDDGEHWPQAEQNGEGAGEDANFD